MANTALVVILEKIASKDKDFRYMATSDLLHELQKDTFKADTELEKKLCAVVLTQLEDPSGDISNLAVSCLGYLARKVADARAEDMVRQLCDKVAGAGPASGGSSAASKARDAQREIAAIGLKALIKELQGGGGATGAPGTQLASSASNIIALRMLEGLTTHKNDSEVVGHVLDILTELIHRFGGLLAAEHCRIRDALLSALGEGRLVMRKKALQGLAALSVFLSDDALAGVVSFLLTALQAPKIKADFARTYIQAVGQISRAVGYRFGRYLATAVPLAISHCDKAAEGDDELREHCLQALEGFVLRCPHDTRPQLEALLAAALRYLRYDPNFAADDDEGGDEDMGDGDDEGDEDADGDDGDEYSDDEDMSWKVRRAATRIVSALVSRYPDALPALYRASLAELVARFDREREEGVKADVFAALSEMLAQVGATAGRYAANDASSPISLLVSDVATIVRASAKQLRDKSPKTRVGVFGVLRQLVAVQASAMSGQVDTLVPGLLAALNDKSGNTGLKIEALGFLRQTIAATPPAVFQPHTKQLAPAVFTCVNERYYKVAAEALRVCEALVGVLRPDQAAPVPPAQAPLVLPLYQAVMTRLSATDQDQEVKECAIGAMAAAVARLGDLLQNELPGVLRVLLERLRNEITRLTAVKALTTLASSPLVGGELLAGAGTGEGGGVAAELTSFLRKANRLLRQASLVALEALASRYPAAFEGAACSAAVEEAAALVSDADVALASLALRFLVSLMSMPGEVGGAAAAVVADKARGPALALVRSPLLQGGALEVLQSFFASLATAGPHGGDDALLAALLDAGRSAEASSKQAQHSVARCVAALATTSPAKVPATVDMLLKSVSAKDSGTQRLALLCLGEIGGRTDLSGLPAVAAAATAVLSAPGSSEEVRAAASHALGGITRGNLPHFMPGLVAQIAAASGQPKQQYLLLQALNDVISTLAGPAGSTKAAELGPDMADQVLALLFGAAESEEECRNVVAECVGRLALLRPGKVLPALLERTGASSANMRAVVVSAVKHAVVDRPHPVDAELGPVLLRFLLLMGDEDRHVRRAAVVALSGCAHAKPGLVVGDLAQLLPLLYAQTVVREDMIRTVDLGPFKHKIDDGLELRKAAFECLDILNDCCRDRLEPAPFIAALESGLGDHADVKMPCHTTLSKLVASDPGAVLAAAERLVVPLEKTLTTRLKSDAVKQEIDRHEDMLRSCLRCVDALAHVPGSDNSAAFQNFLRKVVLSSPALKDKCYQFKCVNGVVAATNTTPTKIVDGYFDGDRFRPYLPAINSSIPDTRGRPWPGNPAESQGVQLVKCWDEQQVITVRVIDSCPCRQVLPETAPGVKPGGEVRRQEWCCGGQNHFDLSYYAFEKLAHPVYGVIPVDYRPVRCDTNEVLPLPPAPGYVSPVVYHNTIQPGWSWFPSSASYFRLVQEGAGPDGSAATCVQLSLGGDLSFTCRQCGRPGYQPFKNASGLSFWIRPNTNSTDPNVLSPPDGGVPPIKLFVLGDDGSSNSDQKQYCFNEVYLNTTVPVETRGSWFKVVVPITEFRCEGAVPLEQLNRLDFQNTNDRDVYICLDQIEITSASADRG